MMMMMMIVVRKIKTPAETRKTKVRHKPESCQSINVFLKNTTNNIIYHYYQRTQKRHK